MDSDGIKFQSPSQEWLQIESFIKEKQKLAKSTDLESNVIYQYQKIREGDDDSGLDVLPNIKIETFHIPLNHKQLQMAWFYPPEESQWTKIDPQETILYIHGGGYLFGSLGGYKGILSRYAHEFGRRILFVDYSLAPETPLPNQIDEGIEALKWLVDVEDIPISKIMLAGDSAGGGFVLLMLQKILADPYMKNTLKPAGSILISPWTDLSLSGESVYYNSDLDYILSYGYNLNTQFTLFLTNGQCDLQDPSVSPLFGQFKGMTPLFFTAGASETLLSDTLRAAHKARAAGVEVRCEIAPFMQHVYQNLGDFPEAIQTRQNMKAFIDNIFKK